MKKEGNGLNLKGGGMAIKDVCLITVILGALERFLTVSKITNLEVNASFFRYTKISPVTFYLAF